MLCVQLTGLIYADIVNYHVIWKLVDPSSHNLTARSWLVLLVTMPWFSSTSPIKQAILGIPWFKSETTMCKNKLVVIFADDPLVKSSHMTKSIMTVEITGLDRDR